MVSGSPEVRSGPEFPCAYRPHAATGDNADAQRKAQSAAAVYKLKHSSSSAHRPESSSTSSSSTSEPYSKIVAGSAATTSSSSSSSARASTPEPAVTETVGVAGTSSHSKLRGSDASLSPPSPLLPATRSEDVRKPVLHVDTSVARSVEETTIVGPLEALKLATGSTIQEPAWAQPFPSTAVVDVEPDDASSGLGSGFSHPFNMGFDGGIHRSGSVLQDRTGWGGAVASAFTTTSRDDHDHHDLLSSASNDNSSSLFAPPPPPSSALSFASIDAIFSHRTESSLSSSSSSDALAGLLGVELTSTPLAHSSSTPQSTKNARSSRFAFANQLSGLELPPSPAAPPTGMLPPPPPPSPFARMEPPSRPVPRPFAFSSVSSSSSSFAMHPDTSAFPPLLGSHHRHTPPPPPPTSSPFGGFNDDMMMGQSGGDMGMGSGGLAFLQQMLPNVNISFGGDYPSHTSGFPQMGGGSGELGHSEPHAGAWSSASLGSLAGLDPSSEPGFYDPAIVSHSTPLQSGGGFYGLGGSLESDSEHRHHHLLGSGIYRHSGSILNNGN